MAVLKICPVLATGCTCVLKPAENTPLVALRLGELLVASGMPKGVVNIVNGLGPEAGEALVVHPDVNKIAFTGSTKIGKHIQQAASETMKRLTLECGGKNPSIILDDADLEVALQASHNGCFTNSGQNCLAGTRVFVQEGIYDEFVARHLELVKTRKMGGPFEADVYAGPLIS